MSIFSWNAFDTRAACSIALPYRELQILSWKRILHQRWRMPIHPLNLHVWWWDIFIHEWGAWFIGYKCVESECSPLLLAPSIILLWLCSGYWITSSCCSFDLLLWNEIEKENDKGKNDIDRLGSFVEHLPKWACYLVLVDGVPVKVLCSHRLCKHNTINIQCKR